MDETVTHRGLMTIEDACISIYKTKAQTRSFGAALTNETIHLKLVLFFH